MTDEKQPGFTVVDKRRAAQANDEAADAAPSPTEPTASKPSDSEPATTTSAHSASDAPAGDAVQDEATEQAGASSGSSQEAADSSSRFTPDPAMLLSLAAMQMDTTSLATALLAVFDGHAWQAMGLVAHPLSGETQKDLATAQLAIDCVQFLLGKVEATLDEQERREAHRRLSDLRMNYVAKLREA